MKPDVVAGAEGVQDTSTKRPAEAPPDDDSRSFKLRKKTATVGLGELYDPGLIPIKLKKKEEKPSETETPTPTPEPSTGQVPKWTAISLKPKDVSLNASTPPIPSSSSSVTPKAEENDTPSQAENPPPPAASRWAKVQWDQPLKEEEVSIAVPSQEPSHADSLANGEPVVKTEEGVSLVKTEPDSSNVVTELGQPTAVLFKKRKAPAGAGRGRRQL